MNQRNTTSSETPPPDFNQYPCKNNCGELIEVYWDIDTKRWCYPPDGKLCGACNAKAVQANRHAYLVNRAALTQEEGRLTVDSFRVSDANRDAHEAVRRMILGDGINLFLCGRAGRGKTHLAIAALNGQIHKRVKFLPLTRWLMEVRSNMKDTSEDQVIEKVLECEVIVLDDFGANKLTDWNLSFLDCVIDEWYRLRRTGLIVTSNFTLKQIAENVSDRIASRLAQMCEVYELTGDDKRLV